MFLNFTLLDEDIKQTTGDKKPTTQEIIFSMQEPSVDLTIYTRK